MIPIEALAYISVATISLALTWFYFERKASHKVDEEQNQEVPDTIDEKTLDAKMRLIYRKIYFIDRK